jgi:hypothetical protein
LLGRSGCGAQAKEGALKFCHKYLEKYFEALMNVPSTIPSWNVNVMSGGTTTILYM